MGNRIKIDERGIVIDGRRIPVVSPEEGEQADAVVCGYPHTPSPFADNIETVCAWCGCRVVHRPTAPQRPPKICIECAIASRSKN